MLKRMLLCLIASSSEQDRVMKGKVELMLKEPRGQVVVKGILRPVMPTRENRLEFPCDDNLDGEIELIQASEYGLPDLGTIVLCMKRVQRLLYGRDTFQVAIRCELVTQRGQSLPNKVGVRGTEETNTESLGTPFIPNNQFLALAIKAGIASLIDVEKSVLIMCLLHSTPKELYCAD
jgi:hypothetical protein